MCRNNVELLDTNDKIVAAVHRVQSSLQRRFQNAHYAADIELAAWSAAGTLFQKPPEQRTEAYLYVIAFRNVYRELGQMRLTFVTDFQSDPQFENMSQDTGDDTFDTLTFNSLDEDEKQMLEWMLKDGLNQRDIAELTNTSTATISRRWRKIIMKLREENL